MADSARARSFDRLLIWLDLHTGGRTQLEARHHRARMHGNHLDLDAEVTQLELDQSRHRLQCFVRIAGLAWRRIIEQREWRQLGGLHRLKQRYLLFLLHAFARLDRRNDRLDARRNSRSGFALLFAHDLGAGLLAFASFSHGARGQDPFTNPADGAQRPTAKRIHDIEPRHAEKKRDSCQPEPDESERRPEKAESK